MASLLIPQWASISEKVLQNIENHRFFTPLSQNPLPTDLTFQLQSETTVKSFVNLLLCMKDVGYILRRKKTRVLLRFLMVIGCRL